MLLKLTVENVNGDCKKLLKSPTNPNPTLVEMIEAYNRIVTLERASETMAAGMVAAFAALKRPIGEARICFGCRKPGHLKKDFLAQNGAKAKAPGIQPWCCKGRHLTNQYHSKYDFEGHQIQGNWSWSTARQYTQTQIPRLTQQPLQQMPQQGTPRVFTQQLEAAPDWTWQPPTQ